MAGPTTIYQGRVEIQEDDVAIALGESIDLGWLVVQAEFSNKQPVAVGSATVTIDGSTTDGPKVIYAKHWHAPPFGACNLSEIYIVGRAGDAVTYIGAAVIIQL